MQSHQEEPQPSRLKYISVLGYSFFQSLSSVPTSSLIGGPIIPGVSHISSQRPWGYTGFLQATDKLIKAAEKEGLVTYWVGPFPVIYVTHHHIRNALIHESHVGVVDAQSEKFLHVMSKDNGVMKGFILYKSHSSETYRVQRQFLQNNFDGGAKNKLPTIVKVTEEFLENYSKKYSDKEISLQSFITLLVLNTSSHLLGLTEYTLDQDYLHDSAYKKIIQRTAGYGVGEIRDPQFEENIYKFFIRIFKFNFSELLRTENNAFKNIFSSLDIPFPVDYAKFLEIPKHIRYKIAMNFAATGVGAMVHSTASTLDWAMAYLLNNPVKLNELTELIANYQGDFSNTGIFDKYIAEDQPGELFPITEWVLHNVFLRPPFSHEFFRTSKAFEAVIEENPDGTAKTTLKIPSNAFIVVNYPECNLNNKNFNTEKKFSESLENQDTIGKFMKNRDIASFGGSVPKKNAKVTRICPAAKTSLYEQVIMIALILRYYSIVVKSKINLDIKGGPQSPLWVRVDHGSIILQSNTKELEQKNVSSKLVP